MSNSLINILLKCKLFDGISASELEAMLGCLNYKVSVFEKNEYIAFAGEGFGSIGIV